MAITSCIPKSAKKEFLNGTHKSTNVYMLALYATATLDADTTVYVTNGEVTGTGYTAAGVTLTGYDCTVTGTTAAITFGTCAWTTATISALGFIIYNQTATNRVCLVQDLGGTYTSTAGTFTINPPAGGYLVAA